MKTGGGGDALSSGSSLEDLHEKQGRLSPKVKRVLNMDDLQEEAKIEQSESASPKLQFSESPIRVVKSSKKREQEERKSDHDLKYHHRRNTLAA